jgi:hypothetical protein
MAAKAKTSSDVRIYLSDGTTPTEIVPTAITSAKPAVVSAVTPPADGAVVYCNDTGFPELDGHFFTTANAAAGTFELVGSDTTGSTGVLSGDPTLDAYEAADMQSLCLSALTYNLETPGTVSVGTYCDPKATLPATAGAAGTLTLTGYIDVQDSAYPAVYAAVKDAKERVLTVVLGQEQGEIVQTVIVAGITWDIPMGDGGMAWTATATLTTEPEHVFEVTP